MEYTSNAPSHNKIFHKIILGIVIFLIIILLVVIGIFFIPNKTVSATCTWTGGSVTSSNWSDTANWSGCTTPASADNIIFDNTSIEDSVIDSGFGGTVTALTINSGYTGTITQDRSFVISGTFQINDGNFQGSSNPSHSWSVGSIDINAGNVTSTAGSLTYTGTFDMSGGTFYHNNGTVISSGSSSSDTVNTSPTLNLYNYTVNRTTGDSGINFAGSGDTIIVENTLTLTDGAVDGSGGSLIAQGDVIINAAWNGGNGILTVSSTDSRTIEVPGGCQMSGIVIDAPNTTVSSTGSGTVAYESGFTLRAGTVRFGPVNHTINTTAVQSGGSIYMGSGNVTWGFNNYTMTGGLYDGETAAITHSTSLVIQGANTQVDWSDNASVILVSTFQLDSGTVTSTGNNLYVRADFDMNGGTFKHNNGTIVFDGSATADLFDVPGSLILSNFTVNRTSNNIGPEIGTGGDTVTVTGTLTLTDGMIRGNSAGSLIAKGNVVISSAWNGGTPTGGVLFVSSTDLRTITVPAGADMGSLRLGAPNTTIDTSGSGVIDYLGTLRIDSGTLSMGSVNHTIASTMTQNGGVWNFGSGTHTLNGTVILNDGNFNAESSILTSNQPFTVQGAGADVDFGTATVTMVSQFAMSGGMVTSTVNNLFIRHNFDMDGGTFYHNNGTLVFDGSSTSDLFDVPGSLNLSNFTVNRTASGIGPEIGTAGDTVTVTGTLTLTDGQIRGSSAGSLIAKSDVSISSAWNGGSGSGGAVLHVSSTDVRTITVPAAADMSSLRLNAPNTTIDTSGSGVIDYLGTLIIDAGTIDMGSVQGNFTSAMTQNGGIMDIGTATSTFGGSVLTINGGTFNVQDGIADINSASLVLNGGTFEAGSTYTYIEDAFTMNGGTFNHNNGTLYFDGSATTIAFTVPGTITMNNITVNRTNASGFVQFASAGGTYNIEGDMTLLDGRYAGPGIVTFSGSGQQYISVDPAQISNIDADIVVNKSGGAVSLASNVTFDHSLAEFVIQEGTFDINGFDMTVYDLIVQDGGIFKLMGTETLTISNSYSNLAGSTFYYYGDTGTIDGLDYYHLTISSTPNTQVLTENTVVNGDLNILVGAIDLDGYNLTVNGNVHNDGIIKLDGDEVVVLANGNDIDSGQVEYNGGTTYTDLVFGDTYYDLRFNNASGSWQATSTVDVNNDLDINAGTFDANANDITLAGDWINSATFSSGGAGTVTLDGADQALQGSTTFYNLTKITPNQTLTFPSSETITIAGAMNFEGSGTSSQMILDASTPGVQAQIDPQGTRDVQYLDVIDNNNIDATDVDCLTGCTDSGNNTNWNFTFIPPPDPVEGSGGNITTTVNVDNATPVITAVIFTTTSGGSAVSEFNLVESSSSTAYVRGSITDDNGCEDFTDDGSVTTTIYRSGAGSCTTTDTNNCYVMTNCSYDECTPGGSDTTLDFQCMFEIAYYADPTNGGGPFTAQNWVVSADATDGTDEATPATSSFEMNSLVAISIGSSINYGNLSLGATSTAVALEITNTGNVTADTNVSGEDMTCSLLGTIPSEQQRYSSSSIAAYSAMTELTGTPTLFALQLPKQTVPNVLSTTSLYWRLAVPNTGLDGVCSATTTLIGVEG